MTKSHIGIATLIITLSMVIAGTKQVHSQTLINDPAVVEGAVADYYDWSRIELNGKATMAGLPISPSIRIYMERGTTIMVSVRAPFVGEVARIEADNDTLFMVNKLNKTFCRESLKSAQEKMPGTLADVQDMLLRRMFLLGQGTMRVRNADDVDVYIQDGNFLLVPRQQPVEIGFNYGYQISPDLVLTDLVVSSTDSDFTANVKYTSVGNGYDMNVVLTNPDPKLSVTFSFDAPKQGAKPMEPFTPTGKYSQLGFKQFLKHISAR